MLISLGMNSLLARIPFKLSSSSITSSKDSKLSLAGEKLSFGSTSSSSQVPPAHLRSLSSLLASPYARQVLDKLKSASKQVSSLIKEEMRATKVPGSEGPCGVEWGVKVGFHAVPSMETVHLHVSLLYFKKIFSDTHSFSLPLRSSAMTWYLTGSRRKRCAHLQFEILSLVLI